MDLEYTKTELNEMLSIAAENGQLKVVKYLLTSPELKEHANIYTKDNESINNALNFGHDEISKYLLSKANFQKFSQSELNSFVEISCQNKLNKTISLFIKATEDKIINISFQNIFISLAEQKNLNALDSFFNHPELQKYLNKDTIVKSFDKSFKRTDFQTAYFILRNTHNEIDPLNYINDYESRRNINFCNRQKNIPTPYQEIKDLLLLKMVNQKLSKNLGGKDNQIKTKRLKI